MTDDANELLELIIAYAQAYCDWDASKYSSAELYEEICKAVEELDKKGQKIKKQQEKIFDLLKHNGWECTKTPDGVGYRFKTLNREEYNALSDKYEALGWCEALEIPCDKLWVRKEGDFYATYLEF